MSKETAIERRAEELADALMNLVDALNDCLSYEVSQDEDAQSAVRHAIRVLDDERFTSYLDAWWLGGPR